MITVKEFLISLAGEGVDCSHERALEAKAALLSCHPLSMSDLDQGSQSRQHHRAAGEERDLESTSLRRRVPTMIRRKGEITGASTAVGRSATGLGRART
jgi:hypothetical protein